MDSRTVGLGLFGLGVVSAFVFLGGSLIALWPDAREERRLAERYAGATARI